MKPPNWVAGVRGAGTAAYYASATSGGDQIDKLMKTLEMVGLKGRTGWESGRARSETHGV